MESEGSLLCSQEPATGPYPEEEAASPHVPTIHLYDKGKVVPVLYSLTKHHAMKAY
jgi:hypothetical protein